jgi:hypothetical protein
MAKSDEKQNVPSREEILKSAQEELDRASQALKQGRFIDAACAASLASVRILLSMAELH